MATKMRDDEFMIWLTMPREHHHYYKTAAAMDNMPLSEFARRALQSAAETKLGKKLPLKKKRSNRKQAKQ